MGNLMVNYRDKNCNESIELKRWEHVIVLGSEVMFPTVSIAALLHSQIVVRDALNQKNAVLHLKNI